MSTIKKSAMFYRGNCLGSPHTGYGPEEDAYLPKLFALRTSRRNVPSSNVVPNLTISTARETKFCVVFWNTHFMSDISSYRAIFNKFFSHHPLDEHGLIYMNVKCMSPYVWWAAIGDFRVAFRLCFKAFNLEISLIHM